MVYYSFLFFFLYFFFFEIMFCVSVHHHLSMWHHDLWITQVCVTWAAWKVMLGWGEIASQLLTCTHQSLWNPRAIACHSAELLYTFCSMTASQEDYFPPHFSWYFMSKRINGMWRPMIEWFDKTWKASVVIIFSVVSFGDWSVYCRHSGDVNTKTPFPLQNQAFQRLLNALDHYKEEFGELCIVKS